MKYLQPAINTLPPQLAQTEVDSLAFQAWTQAVAAEVAYHKNEVLRYTYLNIDFQNWLTSYSAGRLNGGDPSTPPLLPPHGFTVFVADDGVTCDFVQNGPVVCDVPLYVKINPPQTADQAQTMLKVLGGTNSSEASRFNRAVPLYNTQVTATDGSVFIRVS